MIEVAEKAGYTGILTVSNQRGLCTISSRKGEKLHVGEGRGSNLGASVCIDLCRYFPPHRPPPHCLPMGVGGCSIWLGILTSPGTFPESSKLIL